jgi:hypothetical protein
MPNTLVRDAAARAVNLIPFDAGSIRGEGAYVCTPSVTVPAQLRQAQEDRTAFYMSNHTEETGYGRMGPDHGPRYYVTSRGQLIAWVTLDGRTHYTTSVTGLAARHQAMIRAAWPTRFTLTSD